MEGTDLHKRGTSAEGWEAADSASVAPILDGTGEGVPQRSKEYSAPSASILVGSAKEEMNSATPRPT